MEFWWCLDLDKNNNETQVCQIMWVGWYDKRKISCERKSKRLVGDVGGGDLVAKMKYQVNHKGQKCN